MKIVIFGREMVLRKIRDCIVGSGFDVTGTMEEMDEVGALEKLDEFDLAIVDGAADGVDVIWHCLGKFRNVPIVMIVRERQADWGRLRSIDASGYISEGAGRAEISARLGVIIRRITDGRTGEVCLTCVPAS
jgi:DNA-binding NarL/FixJ family response regulator